MGVVNSMEKNAEISVLSLLILVLAPGYTSTMSHGGNGNVVIGSTINAVDNHGCFVTHGELWCASLSKCYMPMLTSCPGLPCMRAYVYI